MAKQNEQKSLEEQVKDKVIDVRNEAIVQTANLYLMARKALLASLGAAAMTLEEANGVVEKLAERGEMVEADIQQWVSEFRAAGKPGAAHGKGAPPATSMSRAGKALEESVEVILNRLNVPTKSDIEALSKKISALNHKVNMLMERQEDKTQG
ncbi:MAG: phasin family protein [Caldilineaceae bacterium]|nr:phasin family protein [Caldilineaceae bacterium]